MIICVLLFPGVLKDELFLLISFQIYFKIHQKTINDENEKKKKK